LRSVRDSGVTFMFDDSCRRRSKPKVCSIQIILGQY
jgi:hypothetical protein